MIQGEKERILVTGSLGLLGSEIKSYLSQKHEVIGVDLIDGMDMSDEEEVKCFFEHNSFDYLVNCFAFNDHVKGERKEETLFDVSLDSFRKYMEVNVTSLFSVCREFARSKRARGIVNFSSTYGVVSPRNDIYAKGEKHIGYSVSKAAVIMLTKHLAVHLAPYVRVNCIVPGGVENNQPDSFIIDYEDNTPMGRMMKKNELNGLIGYLCSDESSYMTGSIITVDGGWTAW